MTLLATTPGLSIDGVVRARGTLEPVAGVLVELADQGVMARTDSTGAYVMHDILPGSHRIRFSRLGYRSFTTDVSVTDGAAMHVDVNLTVDPQWLDTMRVVVAKPPVVTVPGIRQALEPGSFDLNSESLAASPLASRPDVLRDLAASPDVGLDPETPLGLYVRGGAPDQNLVRIDGVPVRAIVHSGESFSTIDEGLLKGVTLHTGAPSASLGGGISSIVDMQTLDATVPSVRAGIDDATVRASASIPLLRSGKAGISIGGGKSYNDVLRLIGETDGAPTAWHDGFVGAHLSSDRTQVRIFSTTAEDGLSLPSLVDCDVTNACTEASQHEGGRPRNFTWSGTTFGAQLTRTLGGRSSAAVHLWSGVSDARLPVQGMLPDEMIRSHLLDRGVNAELETRRSRAQLRTGVELESFTAACSLAQGTAQPHAAPAGCTGVQRSSTVSAYAESTVELSEHVLARAGARASGARGLPLELEPRVVLEGTPAAWLHLTAAYSESHQLLQSLRNYESPLADVVGAEIPVLADGRMFPVVRSRDASASARITFDPATVLQLDAYTRRMSGIFSRLSDGLFIIDDLTTGRERARGLGVLLQHTGRASVAARYSVLSARIYTGNTDFAPRYVPSQTAALGVRYSVTARTTLRASSWVLLGRTSRALTGQVQAEWEDPLSRVREISGTGALDVAAAPGALPSYLRFDLGIEHDLLRARSKERLRVAFNVDNVLDRANVSTWLRVAQGGHDSPVLMIPLSANLSLHWTY